MHDDLVRFLRARLDEDEALAKAATPSPWRTDEYDRNVMLTGESANAAVAVGQWGGDVGPSAFHMVRWQPARVLADIESKRRIIDWVNQWPWRREPPSSVDGLLELLALPYADHPDYQEAWRP